MGCSITVLINLKQGPAIATKKFAMSRALGAAFLNHQVQQLEKTVTDAGQGGNWRDRRTQTGGDNSDGKRSRAPAQAKPIKRRDGDATFTDGDKARQGRDRREQKDADIVVVDASVLIHALGQVKKWCRDGREEIIIVPLEGEFDCYYHFRTLAGRGMCGRLAWIVQGTSGLPLSARLIPLYFGPHSHLEPLPP